MPCKIFIKPVWRRPLGLALFIVFLFIVFTRFQSFGPPYSTYLPIIYYVQNPGVFPVDQFFEQSIYLQASIYYKVISYFKLPIQNDFFALIIITILSGILVFFAAKSIKHHFKLQEIETAISIVFICCFLHSQFIVGSRPSIISILSSSPSGFAHIIGLFAFFSLLRERLFFSCFFATLCIALSPKANLILIPILLIYILTNTAVSQKTLIYLLMPFGYIAWMLLIGEGNNFSHEQLIQLSEQIFLREQEDASFTKQPLLAHALLISAFLFFAFAINKFEDPSLRALGWATFICTAGAYFWGLVYPTIGYKILPSPKLALLAPTLNTRYFSLLVVLMLLTLCLKQLNLALYQKISAIGAIIILKPFYLQFVVALTIVVLTILIPNYLSQFINYRFNKINFIKKIEQVPISLLISGLLVSYTLTRMPQNYVSPSWIDKTAFNFSKTWSAQVWADEPTWIAWSKVRQLKKDFLFFPIYANQRFGLTPIGGVSRPLFVHHESANIYANKSPFRQIPVHGYLDPNLWKSGQKQDIVASLILERINNSKTLSDNEWLGSIPAVKERIPITFNQYLGDYLQTLKCVIMVPKSLEHLFLTKAPSMSIDNFTLFFFGIALPR